ncbi:MAG: hypothetical protein HQL44_12275 [Alphaproteobacteria bacterium]|nr:hypothetical protein [Alphaproteobacteria bacterium]
METLVPHPDRLNRLSLHYDGPLPPERLRLALAQSDQAAARGLAMAQARFLAAMAGSSRQALAGARQKIGVDLCALDRLQTNLKYERDQAVGWISRAEAWPE